MRREIFSKKVCPPVGPYSQAVETEQFVFVSGQLPLDSEGGTVGENAAEQARQCPENMKAIVEESGLTLENVVKTTIFVTDIAEYPAVNQVYSEFFKKPFPARAVVCVKALPKNALVEIEAIAAST